jgi:hypothetical protein
MAELEMGPEGSEMLARFSVGGRGELDDEDVVAER